MPEGTLTGVHIGLKVDVDTLRGTREGVPRLAALLKRHGVDATFYFSVGPDHTGRALRRVFRKGFAQKVARTSVVKHYGLKTLMYGVLLPGPDIGAKGGAEMRAVHDSGFEVGLHTYDHVRWQDFVAQASPAWTRVEFERGLEAFERVFGFLPESHAAAGWQMNAHALELERDHGLRYASDTRGGAAFFPALAAGRSTCPQLPTTLPTFDELLGLDGIDESNIAEAVFERSRADVGGGVRPDPDAGGASQEGRIEGGVESGATRGAGRAGTGGAYVGADPGTRVQPEQAGPPRLHVFTLHAELEGMRLLDAFESLLVKWRDAGATITRMAEIHALAMQRPLPTRSVIEGEIPGRSGLLAVQAPVEAAL